MLGHCYSCGTEFYLFGSIELGVVVVLGTERQRGGAFMSEEGSFQLGEAFSDSDEINSLAAAFA